MEKQRLDRFISNQTGLSRSVVRTGIKRGSAFVNGNTVRDAAYNVDPESDIISYAGKTVGYKKFVYIMLNKPSGIISASRDKSRKTVLDLVPDHLKRRDLSVVGRLDKDTTGLLLITDDGEFAHKCISPKSKTEKSYIVTLDSDIKEDAVSQFANGIVLADGYKCKPAVLEILADNKARVILTEGKYHQIKRMFGVLGLGVDKLHRERIGALFLPDDLPPGECQEINKTTAMEID